MPLPPPPPKPPQAIQAQAQELASGLAMHAVGMRTQYLSRKAVPAEVLQREREVLAAQAAASGKPAAVVAKMVEGRLGKFFEEACLLEQRYLLDDSKKVRPGPGASPCPEVLLPCVPGISRRPESRKWPPAP
jgi:hypothetical protein